MSTEVLAVVSNFRRPENIGLICQQLAGEPCDIIVADNSPTPTLSEDYELKNDTLQYIKDVWRWTENSGPPARWYPALAWTHQYRYVMLVDDDYLLSEGLVSALLQQATILEDRFAVIGRIGRNFTYENGRWSYHRRNIWEGTVDMVGGGYFLLAERLVAAIQFRDKLVPHAEPDMLWHDDLILNCGIQREYGHPSYMPTQRWSGGKLSTHGYAFNTLAAYRDVRDDMINLCYQLGWRSLREAD